MPFIRNIRVARLITPQISGKCPAISRIPRRMASFYSANIAGLTEEQVEVRQCPLREDNTRLTTQLVQKCCQ
jgi:hypothetical protein